jgi:hypothetical protein
MILLQLFSFLQDRVLALRGGHEWLLAVGFTVQDMANAEGVKEPHYFMTMERASQTDVLQQARQMLVEAQPIALKLHRYPQVCVCVCVFRCSYLLIVANDDSCVYLCCCFTGSSHQFIEHIK